MSLISVLVFFCCIAMGITPAVAQESGDPEDETPAGQITSANGATWTLNARLRPRLEGRLNHRFGLAEEELNYPTADEDDNFTNQTRLGATVQADEVSADLMLQHAGVWGTTGGDSLTDPTLAIHRASFTWQPLEAWSLQMGRFELAYGDERVLGSVGWSQVGRSWDGLRTGIAPLDGLEVDLFGARYAEGASSQLAGYDGGIFEDDAFLTGLYASASESWLGVLEAADLYALYDIRFDRPGTDGSMRRGLATLGTRLDGAWEPVDANLEGAYQFGNRCVEQTEGSDCTDEKIGLRGWFVDAEVGVSFGSEPTGRLFAGFSQASGDDPNTDTDEGYRQLYPTGHKWLGFTDIIGPRRNLREFRGGGSLSVGPLQVTETVHHFTRLQPDTETAGLEFDTTVGVEAGEHVAAKVGHGLFVPYQGMSSTDTAPEGLGHWAFLQFVAQL